MPLKVAQVRTIQPGWEYEWKKPSQLTDQQLLNVCQVIPGPFNSPRLLKIFPFIIQTEGSQTEINEKKFCQGIPDLWMEYVALQEINDRLDKNFTEYIFKENNMNITKAMSKIGVSFEQGIPNPWKVYSPTQVIKMIYNNQANNYNNIQTNEPSNKKKGKTKKFMKKKDNDVVSNSCGSKIRDKNLDKLKVLSSKTCENDSQNDNYLGNSQVKSDNMNLTCCQCNCSYLKFGKLHEYEEQRHKDDNNCKSSYGENKKMKNLSKNAYVNVTSRDNETGVSICQSLGRISNELYLQTRKWKNPCLY